MKKIAISQKDIMRYSGVNFNEDLKNFVRSKLSEAGFDLNKRIDREEDFETCNYIFTQED